MLRCGAKNGVHYCWKKKGHKGEHTCGGATDDGTLVHIRWGDLTLPTKPTRVEVLVTRLPEVLDIMSTAIVDWTNALRCGLSVEDLSRLLEKIEKAEELNNVIRAAIAEEKK